MHHWMGENCRYQGILQLAETFIITCFKRVFAETRSKRVFLQYRNHETRFDKGFRELQQNPDDVFSDPVVHVSEFFGSNFFILFSQNMLLTSF